MPKTKQSFHKNAEKMSGIVSSIFLTICISIITILCDSTDLLFDLNENLHRKVYGAIRMSQMRNQKCFDNIVRLRSRIFVY